jgi:hypothetical protein
MPYIRFHESPDFFLLKDQRPFLGAKNRRVNGVAATLVAAVVAMGFTSFLLVAPLQPAHAEVLDGWTPTASYPSNVTGQLCVTSTGYVYCVGGSGTDAAYFAPVSSSGMGIWTSTTSYPQDGSTACVASDGFIYCVGNNEENGVTISYYAPLSSSGIGAWVSTTNFPSVTVDDQNMNVTLPLSVDSCAASQGYIYCVGLVPPIIRPPPDPVYYAPISSSGIGTWTSTTTYPTDAGGQPCVISSDYIYCVGGSFPTFPGETSNRATNEVDYAPILASGGLGTWTATTSYPLPILGQSCAIAGNYLYCVGGYIFVADASSFDGLTNAAYFAEINAGSQGGGLGAWTSTTSYPVSIMSQSCVVPSTADDLYCIGGGDSDEVYYSSISTQSPPTSQLTVDSSDSTGDAITGYYTLLYDQNGTVVATGFTPVTFTVDTGQTYIVQVDDYGSCQFSMWGDSGSPSFTSSTSRTVSIAGDVAITAIYGCTTTGIASSVTIDSVDQNGNAIFGYHTALYDSSGRLYDDGFTSASFPTTTGQTFSVQAESYGSCTFSQWSDGVTSNPRTFTATSGALVFTAAYDCSTTTTTTDVSAVQSVDGIAITGYYVTLWQNGTQLQSCFSPCSFTVNDGQTYQVAAASYGSETFSHWQNDGATGFETFTAPSNGDTVSLTAVYGP